MNDRQKPQPGIRAATLLDQDRRRERLAAALRDNLLKRKRQDRARTADVGATDGGATDMGATDGGADEVGQAIVGQAAVGTDGPRNAE